jgi:hypothetical protein
VSQNTRKLGQLVQFAGGGGLEGLQLNLPGVVLRPRQRVFEAEGFRSWEMHP